MKAFVNVECNSIATKFNQNFRGASGVEHELIFFFFFWRFSGVSLSQAAFELNFSAGKLSR